MFVNDSLYAVHKEIQKIHASRSFTLFEPIADNWRFPCSNMNRTASMIVSSRTFIPRWILLGLRPRFSKCNQSCRALLITFLKSRDHFHSLLCITSFSLRLMSISFSVSWALRITVVAAVFPSFSKLFTFCTSRHNTFLVTCRPMQTYMSARINRFSGLAFLQT